jgi:hypothetical protein
MGALLSALASWLLGMFARVITFGVNHFMATKIILGILFVTILPIIINNAIYDLMSTMFTAINTYAGSIAPTLNQSIQFTGLAGYLFQALGLQSCFSVILSAMAFRFAISWIPFVGPK